APKEATGGAAQGGQITFGGVDTANCASNWTAIPVEGMENWMLAIAGVQIGPKNVRPSAEYSSAKIALSFPLLDVPNAYFRKIVGALGGEYDFELDRYTVDCGKVVSLPRVNITIGTWSPLTYAVPPKDFVTQL
ncbi:aspartic protease, partial [Aphelenchoides avenae]